jgi:hypothetical protein
MKHKHITEMEIEETKRKPQASQRSHQEERGEGELEHPGSMGDGEEQPSTISTKEKKKWKFINIGSRFTN